MAKTTGPLLSFGARGQIGKTLVFAPWKGTQYARQHVVPSNPQSAEQTITRNAFSFLQSVYKTAPALFTDPWDSYVQGIPMTSRNAFTKFNLPDIRDQADLTNFVGSPGAKGGLPPTAVAVAPGDDQLAVTVTAPSVLPQGWTIYSAVVAVIADQDPDSGALYTVSAGEDLTSAYVITLTGLTTATLYQVRAWLKWNRPDGTFAFSPSINSTGLTT